ncbi:type I restriction endonuclease subunit R [Listeria seeligeri]|uniref:type I restriction endonuclease subunit R n=1 Tax=Listeria seeligeri TaxID=1640 RepID=UPI001628385A|nr:HsdR family type I site-specific deoxyribonuclease [Listeria seeligeri]MBC1470912.1 type I restriction endonuclease subunit R [Listeria seeligeri]
MGNTIKKASEKAFQENFVKELQNYKWDAPDFLDGNKQKVTVNDLINHWRGELNRLNADQLEGVPLTDGEFKQVMSKVNKIKNSYDAAKLLAIEEGKGKIDGIYRDDNPKVTRKQITLTIFKKAEVRGGESSYKIAREVEAPMTDEKDKTNRFDIVLLINGLPLINVEQKRADKPLDEAFEQFKRYYRNGEYTNNFMAFSQMMVMTTEIETRYFATPKSIKDFNQSFVFHWSDKNNKPMNNWKQIVANFLMIPMAHQMVGDYLIIDEAKEEENKRHMLMRPYQVYALQAVEGAAFGWDQEDKIPHGGFVWHTTGSGKTITSFKTALFLSTRAGFDKVVFLVDRRELDNRTSANFKSYATFESVSVDDTEHTYHLKKELKSSKAGIIVSTTFKLNSLVKELEESHDNSLADKKIVFIIDEAHRTTMGQMMGNIKKYFKKKGLFYGFTGTPLFDENEVKGKVNDKSELINTTEKLFGKKLHNYTIDEAIADGNVLGFNVDYINTGEFENYDALRDKLIERMLLEKPESGVKETTRLVCEYSELEVEKEAAKIGLLAYHDDTHIPRVVEEILANWETQSQAQTFNAILTVAYKKRVIAYYNEFKKQQQSSDKKINIAMTFSFGSENDPDNVAPETIEKMFSDYAEFTGINLVAGDKKHGEAAYFEDVVERATRGGSGRNEKNIDLIIVADQLLTGYDSKYLNTLYVDRHLKRQSLIQAYSRTNRVLDKRKEFGSVVNFQYPRMTEEEVNKALKLYGNGGKSSLAIVDIYDTAVKKLRIKINKMILTLPDPTAWATLENDEIGKKEFIEAFRDAAIQWRKVEQYYEYVWKAETFGTDEHTWLLYMGAYNNLMKEDQIPHEESISEPLPGKTRLSRNQKIDAAHILSLIDSKVDSSGTTQFADKETLRLIYEDIQELSNRGEHNQAMLLKDFVEQELVPGKITSDITFDDAFEAWKREQEQVVIHAFAKEWGIIDQGDLLAKSVMAYSEMQPEVIPYFEDLIGSVEYEIAENKVAGNQLEHKMKLREKMPEWIAETRQRYN